MDIDSVQLNFNPATQLTLQWVLALIMFGVALDLRVADFKRLAIAPKAPLIGLACQFVLMPALAWAIVIGAGIHPSLALGMILVAACPGGNLSNFLTNMSGGSTAVSVTMSAISTVAAIVMTPWNLAFWGGMSEHTAGLLQTVSVSSWDVLEKVVIMLVIPTIAGMLVAKLLPGVAARLKGPMRIGSMMVFLIFVIGGFSANWRQFIEVIGYVFLLVLIVNAAGFALGFGMGKLSRLPTADCKAICFETGIQNTGFGLIIALEFFEGLGGVALVAGWWGIWHILSGMTLALLMRHRMPGRLGHAKE